MTQRIDEITFNGLDRPAMLAGAPIKPLGMSFLVLAMISLLCSLINGLVLFSVMLLIIPIWFALKLLCEHDENALTVMRYSIACYLAYRFNLVGWQHKNFKVIRLNKNRLFIIPTYLPTRYGDEA